MIRPPPRSPLFPYTPPFRSHAAVPEILERLGNRARRRGREGRKLRVGLGLPAEGKQRYSEIRAPTPQLLEALRSEEHTSELQSRQYLVCRLLLEKKK